jgi:hypothetical protein
MLMVVMPEFSKIYTESIFSIRIGRHAHQLDQGPTTIAAAWQETESALVQFLFCREKKLNPTGMGCYLILNCTNGIAWSAKGGAPCPIVFTESR